MLTKSDAFLQRKEQNSLFFGFDSCCGGGMVECATGASKNERKMLKKKISMREVMRQFELKDFDRGSLRKVCSTSLLREEASIKNLSVTNKPSTQLHFTYANTPLSQYPKNIASQNGPPCNSLSNLPPPPSRTSTLSIKLESSLVPLQNQDNLLSEQELIKTVKTITPQPKTQDAYQSAVQTSTNLLKKSQQSPQRRQKSQLPSKNQGFEQGLDRPRPCSFQRGTLFKGVRKSQTINTDAKSDSSSSIVMEDYKSLMSKIQEREEELQQI